MLGQFLIRFFSAGASTKDSHKRKLKANGPQTIAHGGVDIARLRRELLQLEENPSPRYQPPSDEPLSDEQQTIFDLIVRSDESVFFTGPAGTGKTMLLKRIIAALSQKHPAHAIAITASTGLAAFNISGTTLHRFAGIGLGQAPTQKLITDIMDNYFAKKRWQAVEVLVIDEISMIDSTLFDKLDLIAQAVRRVYLPFGGIQLVLSGDFFQLPPVSKGGDDASPRFCFEAEAWKHAIQHTMSLTQNHRQKDKKFTMMLNEIREGHASRATINTFRKLSRPLRAVSDDETEPIQLFPLRRGADSANARRLQDIQGPIRTFVAVDGGSVEDDDTRDRLLKDCIAPKTIELKKGAQVMLTANVDSLLVNGSQGRVIGFATYRTYLDMYCNIDSDDEPTDEELRIHVLRHGLPEETPYPVVRFDIGDGETQTAFCAPVQWSVERWKLVDGSDEEWELVKLATRKQIPLVLAWALSIHKAQGQTLKRVTVDLANVFEWGQAYVALSRATSLDGLQVLNFYPGRVKAHPKVKMFYAGLSKG